VTDHDTGDDNLAQTQEDNILSNTDAINKINSHDIEDDDNSQYNYDTIEFNG
jgi:hypothetical protein